MSNLVFIIIVVVVVYISLLLFTGPSICAGQGYGTLLCARVVPG